MERDAMLKHFFNLDTIMLEALLSYEYPNNDSRNVIKGNITKEEVQKIKIKVSPLIQII